MNQRTYANQYCADSDGKCRNNNVDTFLNEQNNVRLPVSQYIILGILHQNKEELRWSLSTPTQCSEMH